MRPYGDALSQRFPEAVAVADPALQMRRKLAETRHAADRPDGADFLPVMARVGDAMKAAPAVRLREAAFENGRMRLGLDAVDDASLPSLIARLRQSGLRVEQGRAADAVVLTVSGT